MNGEKCVNVLLTVLLVAALASCEDIYGTVGGADITDTYTAPEDIETYLEEWQGSWYSHYGSRALDGYIVGKWKDIDSLGVKLRVFDGFDPEAPQFLDPRGYLTAAQAADDTNRGQRGVLHDEDFFIMYDDTVYGQSMNGYSPDYRGYSYIGIVRGINIFDHDPNHGSVVVEYLAGCFPERYPFQNGTRPIPFLGIYYRVISPSSMQMVNPIKLADRINGLPYYTETASLPEAFALNTVDNDIEFVDWGEATPMDYEGCKL